jgi:glucan biosynthesis protein C
MMRKPTPRLYYVDYLRVALIVLVVAHHSAQAYGPTGGTWPITNPEISRLLGPFLGVNTMVGMALFFLAAGYFVPAALDRRGAGAFTKSRLLRLGLPTLFLAVFVNGPIAYLTQPGQSSLVEFVRYLYEEGWLPLYGHLWFVVHLLVYSFVYVILRLVAGRIRGTVPSAPAGPKAEFPQRVVTQHGAILLFVIGLALVSFVIRINYPIDHWVPVLIFPVEPFHLPQYISMFGIGILAYRGDWLRKLPTATGMFWLAIGITAAAGYYVYQLLLTESVPDIVDLGGKSWRSLAFSVWEALVCAGLGVGLLILFRERFSRAPGKLLVAIIGAAFGAYIIHLYVVIGVQAGMDAIALAPFIKFLIVTLIAAILSFGIAHLAKKAPGLRRFV